MILFNKKISPEIHNSTKSPESTNIQINRPRPNIAATGQRDGGGAETGEKRPNDEEPTSDFPNLGRTRLHRPDGIGINQDFSARNLDLRAERAQNGGHGGRVGEGGGVGDLGGAGAAEGGGEDRQRGVLGAANGDVA